jgi:hypothetical protein
MIEPGRTQVSDEWVYCRNIESRLFDLQIVKTK